MEAIHWNLLRLVAQYVHGYRNRRRRLRTERIMNELPPSIRKDIGWPRDVE